MEVCIGNDNRGRLVTLSSRAVRPPRPTFRAQGRYLDRRIDLAFRADPDADVVLVLGTLSPWYAGG